MYIGELNLLNPSAQKRNRYVHEKRNGQQNEPESHTQAELALVGFQCDGRCYRARVPFDISPDHHGNSHLRHDAAISGDRAGQNAVSGFPQSAQKELPAVGPHGHNRRAEFLIHAFDSRRSQTDDDGKRQNRLTDGNAGQGKEQTEVTQRTTSGQKSINHQTDEHRRQGHHGIDNGSERLFPVEIEIAEAKSERYPHKQAGSDRITGYQYSDHNRRIRFGIATYQQMKTLKKSF